jgi:PAS domain S-box-containing protein
MATTKPSLTTSQLETAFESMGEGSVIINNKGVVVRANRVALELLGYSEDELIGERFLHKVKALNVDYKPISLINRPAVRSVISGRTVYEYLYFEGKSRSRIPVFVSASTMVEDGKPIGVMEVFRDISMEEAVDQMKSEFISLASHQLRTPLSSIKTYSHMLLDGYMGEIDSQKRPALEIIVAATNRMNELISTLLNITRLESGAIVVQKSTVDIAQIAREVIAEMDIPARNRSIQLKLGVSGKHSTKIRSDGPIIKEVLTNLVSNSVKYTMDNGTVSLFVRSSENNVSLIVRDSGVGIPEPAKEQIFSKFFRAHNVIQIETNGTGLGLYLVKGLVDELGGKITFTSEEGKGTAFKVRLPRKMLIKK